MPDGRRVIRLQLAGPQGVRDRASLGDTRAQFTLGLKHRYGLDEHSRDLKLAEFWFEQAAELGHVEAMINMGLLYHYRDFSTAMFWYKLAEAQGSELASNAMTGRLSGSSTQALKHGMPAAQQARQPK